MDVLPKLHSQFDEQNVCVPSWFLASPVLMFPLTRSSLVVTSPNDPAFGEKVGAAEAERGL
jgi:hypothetical protein